MWVPSRPRRSSMCKLGEDRGGEGGRELGEDRGGEGGRGGPVVADTSSDAEANL